MMTDYNDGKWHGWNGGECPVDPDALVQTIWLHKDGEVREDARDGLARGFPWVGNEYGDIIAFRVTKPAPPKPREWWLNPEGRGVIAYDEAEMPEPWVHVIEVLPNPSTKET